MTRTPGTDPAPYPSALQGCLEACRRCEIVVRTIAADRSEPARATFRAVGAHLRHCLDHFECLLQGLDTGLVDYDARERREVLERDAGAFLTAMASVVERLGRLDPASIRHTLRLRQEATPGEVAEVESSLERELIFLSGHTIHHIAIVRLVAEARGLTLPSNLDVAYSTATYQRHATQDVAASSS